MFVFLLSFLFFGLAAFMMVYWRLYEIENGHIRVSGVPVSYLVFVDDISKIVITHVKRASIIFTARTLYFFSKALDWARSVIQKAVVRMEAMLVRRSGSFQKQGAVSLFLKDIAEHKRITKIRIRRKAREEKQAQ